jgi:iron complex outermembrane receptor protein
MVFAAAALAQNAATPSEPMKGQTETLVVLGAARPVPLAESERAVEALPVKAAALAAESPQDFLRQDASVFIEERGAGGGQADVTMRGGSFGQTLVLLDGFRIDDAQTAHHTFDLPVPMEAIDSIQTLAGAGSTLHGADALGGVVDFLTAAPSSDSLYLRVGGGSFESNEESLTAETVRRRWSGRAAAERNFSTGFMSDRDYRNENIAAESWLGSRLGASDLLLAASDRGFGANKFYGDYPSWERTKGWFAGVRQELGEKTVAAFAYRRHTDEFVLYRDAPSYYENNHRDGAWQASLRRTEKLPAGAALLLGIEEDGDGIESSNLGVHGRNRGAGYADLDLRPAKRRWSLSAGGRVEIFSGGGRAVFSPELAGSFRARKDLKLRASGGYGFRIPTYTDLYYSDPTTLGNAKLKPESAWSGEAGADWNLSAKLTATATGFYSRQHDTIDYLRAAALPNAYLPATCTAAKVWCAANLNELRLAGVETRLTWVPVRSQTVRAAWTKVAGAQGALHGLESEYVFNYPTENLRASWSSGLGGGVALTNTVQVAERRGQRAYAVWNATMARDRGRLQPYLRLSNLSNTGYEEIENVRMPSRAIMGGFALRVGK